MTPNTIQILTCPYCGAKKGINNYNVGGTHGITVWSDNITDDPLQPRAAIVQRCPSCGKYYLLSRQKAEYGTHYPFIQEVLSYNEIKEAWYQLQDTENLTENERLGILITQVWTFNDKYTRYSRGPVPSEEKTYIRGIIEQIIQLDMVDDILKSELLREAGRFKEASEILDSYSTGNNYLNKLKEIYKRMAVASDTHPFIIYQGSS